jgi:pyruvate kinase
MEDELKFYVTLWPSFPHFQKFSVDTRLSGIRLNSAMMNSFDLDKEFAIVENLIDPIPLYFDIKGRQLRVKEVIPNNERLELILNHPINVNTPTMTLFKAGADGVILDKVVDGNHLIFDGGPEYKVYPGESLHIRDKSLEVLGPTFLDYEIDKIEKAKKAGFDKYFLSYVESQKDIDEFREFVGDSEIIAKIENKKGLEYVANNYKKQKNLNLMAARGDLYVEIDKPHEIMDALNLIISKDKGAHVGSRILLSIVRNSVPECCDFTDLAYLYDIGYRKMMLCDELCLKEEWLDCSVNVLDVFRDNYTKKI